MFLVAFLRIFRENFFENSIMETKNTKFEEKIEFFLELFALFELKSYEIMSKNLIFAVILHKCYLNIKQKVSK